MNATPYKKPLPRIDPLNRPFWDHAKRGELAMQVCDKCGDMHHPPSPNCPVCLSTDQHWQVVSGRGELLSWVEFHHLYWEGFREDLPYRVCLVGLEEGPMLISSLVGTEGGDPPIGSSVKVIFDPVTDDVTLPRFELT